jgi:hypothetical protein
MGESVAAPTTGTPACPDGRATLVEELCKALEELHAGEAPRACCHRGCAGCVETGER